MNKQEAKKLETKIIEILTPFIKNGDTIIAAVSGGPDSVFLLEIIKKLPIKIIIAHVNHSLRGEESKKDSDFVKSLCKTETFELKTADINKLSKQLKKGLEETGRIIRYKFFDQLAKKHQASYILTAHHADDNLETIIFNLTRGATLKGLAGIKLVDKNLLRPLLHTSKKEIIDYLKHHKIPFRKDKTNKNTDITRNFIRHKIVPQLKKLNPRVTEVIAKNSKLIRQTTDFVQERSEHYLNKLLTHESSTKVEINAKNFRALPEALKENIIRICYKKLIGNTQNLEAIHLNEVLNLISKNIGNKSKKFGKCEIGLKNNIIGLKKSAKK